MASLLEQMQLQSSQASAGGSGVGLFQSDLTDSSALFNSIMIRSAPKMNLMSNQMATNALATISSMSQDDDLPPGATSRMTTPGREGFFKRTLRQIGVMSQGSQDLFSIPADRRTSQAIFYDEVKRRFEENQARGGGTDPMIDQAIRDQKAKEKEIADQLIARFRSQNPDIQF